MTRIFDDKPAVREKTPLLIGAIGPSGTGKTFSLLRLATGIQRVTGGDIFVIDTEARRALHYADRFKFRHVPMGAPFAPLDYLAAIEHCMKKGAGTILVDSMSHEHEGPGGVLEMHEAECKRLARGDVAKLDKVKMLAWQKPKMERRRLINTMLQMPCNFLFGFRAKPKIKIVKGEDPLPLGFQPIAGDEFVYELTAKFLLLPGANGFPTWQSDMEGEKMMIKLPEQFRELFSRGPQLSEDVGQAMATWAAGVNAPPTMTADELCAEYAACSDSATFGRLEGARQLAWSKLGKDKARVKQASDDAKERIDRAERFSDTETGGADEGDDSAQEPAA